MVEATYDAQQNPNTGSRVKALSRQPTVIDYAQNSQYRVILPNFPISEYFCTEMNVPGVTMTQVDRPSSLTNIPMVGDQLAYENFTMTFIVDEELKNFQEIYDWMVNMGFPYKHSQYKSKERADGMDQRKGDRVLYDDLLITILSSKNNPVVRCKLFEAFPISLSGLTYTQTNPDVEYLTASVEFAYMYYEFKPL